MWEGERDSNQEVHGAESEIEDSKKKLDSFVGDSMVEFRSDIKESMQEMRESHL